METGRSVSRPGGIAAEARSRRGHQGEARQHAFEPRLQLPQEDIEHEGDGNFSSESLDDYLERVERSAIEQALAKTNQNKTAAAKLLGISFRALRYKLEKLGLE